MMDFLNAELLAPQTDEYQLKMAQGDIELGKEHHQAVFHGFYRRNPLDGGFGIFCGLESLKVLLKNFRFDEKYIQYLGKKRTPKGKPMFRKPFLDYLRNFKWTGKVYAVPEGSVVFPHMPLFRVEAPLPQCRLFESIALTLVNFPTFVATKAARICFATGGSPLIEMALRRAPSPEAALIIARSAHIAGCATTSNELAAYLMDIPSAGSMAHSWVHSFQKEVDAFRAWAKLYPDMFMGLIDTYDSIPGAEKAILIGKQLSQDGHEMQGLRLDSGNLLYLANEARKMLDAVGLHSVKIAATNDLDEFKITLLRSQNAPIDIYGVGTALAVGTVGGVYKMGALELPDGSWISRIKTSLEEPEKASLPDPQQVRRYFNADGMMEADQIYSTLLGPDTEGRLFNPNTRSRGKAIPTGMRYEDLLIEICNGQGEVCHETRTVGEIRNHTAKSLASLNTGAKLLANHWSYPAGMGPKLHQLRESLIFEASNSID